MIAQIIVVEGQNDLAAIRRAVEAEVLCTGGFAFGRDVEARLKRGHASRGLIVLTDPDAGGAQIRRRVEALVGDCVHAHLPREACTRDGDIGVEHASAEAIRSALDRARASTMQAVTEFTEADLFRHGLNGGANARARRAALGERLGIGFGNARQLLRRLNAYGVRRDEFNAAVATLMGED